MIIKLLFLFQCTFPNPSDYGNPSTLLRTKSVLKSLRIIKLQNPFQCTFSNHGYPETPLSEQANLFQNVLMDQHIIYILYTVFII